MKKLTTQEVELMGSDSQLIFGGTFEGGYNLQQVPDEIVPCINDITKSGVKIKHFLEVGSAAGGSTYLFNYAFDLESIVIIDDNKHPKHIYREGVIKKIKCPVAEFIGDSLSKDAVDFVGSLKKKFDIMLLDASHNYADVELDIRNYGQFLNKDGFMLIHDIDIFKHVGILVRKIGEGKEYRLVKQYLSKTHPVSCGIGMLQKK